MTTLMHAWCCGTTTVLLLFLLSNANSLPVPADEIASPTSIDFSGVERRAVINDIMRCPVTSAQISFFGIEAKGTRNQEGGRIFSSYFDGTTWSNNVLGNGNE